MALAAELEAVAVSIDVDEDVTRVEATYRLGGETPFVFRARQIDGQQLSWLSEGIEIEERGGLAMFESAAGDLEIRYELRGERQRIPLFVPDVVATGKIELRLRGLGEEAANTFFLRDAFPRFVETERGLLAEPANLPSLIRLPPGRGRLTVHRASEAAVLLLITLASVVWMARRRRQVV